MEKEVVIIGAGPAGLTAAFELSKHQVPATILEASPTNVGGIAQTAQYKGYRFDIGGHRFFSKSKEINNLWDEMLTEDFMKVNRLSRIYYNKKFFDYPIKATNALFGLGIGKSTKVLGSYLKARMFPLEEEKTFEQWITNRFGKELYQTFFKTYTEKVWGMPCNEISAAWAAQRIKGLSLTQAVKNAILPQKTGKIKTLISEFKYPRLGPGMLWEDVAQTVQDKGHKLHMDQKVVRINRDEKGITSVIARDKNGKEKEYPGTHFVSTMAMRTLMQAMVPKVPDHVMAAANRLKYRDFLTVALIIDQKESFPDNWIYIHEPGVKLGRVQNFANWSPDLLADKTKTCLGLEYFCFEGDGLWAMKDEDLVEFGRKELSSIGLVDYTKVIDGTVIRMPKAYPVYDDEYTENVNILREFIAKELPNLQLAGRNGMHRYNNQDHAMMTALLAAKNILGGSFDQWNVNTDAEYHEEGEDTNKVSERLVPRRVEEP